MNKGLVTSRIIRTLEFGVLGFAFLVPFSQFLSVRLLLILVLFSIYIFRSDFLFQIFKKSWDLLLYYIVLVVGLIYSSDLDAGLRVLETNFSFLAIPLIVSRFSSLNVEIRDRIFKSFLLGVIATSLICLSYATYRYANEPSIQFFFFETFTEIIKSHPTYLAYYIIFSITVELYGLYHSKFKAKLLFHYLVIFFLFVILILTGGQTAFISMLFVFSFFILKFLTEERSRDRKRVIGGVIGMLICMFLVSFVEKSNLQLVLNDSWERASLWKSAIAATSNIFIGVGTGDYKVALNEYYITHGMTLFALESYNAHNQFIQILFSNGLLGLFSVILMMGRPLYIGVKTNNVLSILCIFPFLIYGITEVFLGRYQGVVFFALVHQIFLTEMKPGIGYK